MANVILIRQPTVAAHPDSSGYSGRTDTEYSPLGAFQIVPPVAFWAAARNGARSAPLTARQRVPSMSVVAPAVPGSAVSGHVITGCVASGCEATLENTLKPAG